MLNGNEWSFFVDTFASNYNSVFYRNILSKNGGRIYLVLIKSH